MEIYGSHFTYRGKDSRLYNLVFSTIEEPRYTNKTSNISGVTMFDNKTRRQYLLGDDYSSAPISFDVEITTCDGRVLDRIERKEIRKWLFNSSTYEKLYFNQYDDDEMHTTDYYYDDDDSFDENGLPRHSYLNCRFMNPAELRYNGGVVGYKVTLEADSPFMWQDKTTKTHTIPIGTDTIEIDIDVDSDVHGYIYPKIVIHPINKDLTNIGSIDETAYHKMGSTRTSVAYSFDSRQPTTMWASGVAYKRYDRVIYESAPAQNGDASSKDYYYCKEDHTSGNSFESAKWEKIGSVEWSPQKSYKKSEIVVISSTNNGATVDTVYRCVNDCTADGDFDPKSKNWIEDSNLTFFKSRGTYIRFFKANRNTKYVFRRKKTINGQAYTTPFKICSFQCKADVDDYGNSSYSDEKSGAVVIQKPFIEYVESIEQIVDHAPEGYPDNSNSEYIYRAMQTTDDTDYIGVLLYDFKDSTGLPSCHEIEAKAYQSGYISWHYDGLSYDIYQCKKDVTVWSSGETYRAGDFVAYQGSFYKCKTNHEASANFSEDSSKWTVITQLNSAEIWSSVSSSVLTMDTLVATVRAIFEITTYVGESHNITICNKTDSDTRKTIIGTLRDKPIVLDGSVNYVTTDHLPFFANRNFVRLIDGENKLTVEGEGGDIVEVSWNNRRML